MSNYIIYLFSIFMCFSIQSNSQVILKTIVDSRSSSNIIVNLINDVRANNGLQKLTEIQALNNAAEYHGKYLYKLLPYFNSKNDFANFGKKLIDGTPQGHFENVDVKDHKEILKPTGRAALFTKGDTLVAECAQVLFSYNKISKNDTQKIFENYMNSIDHKEILMLKSMLKSVDRDGTKNFVTIKEIGSTTLEVEFENSNEFKFMYVNVILVR